MFIYFCAESIRTSTQRQIQVYIVLTPREVIHFNMFNRCIQSIVRPLLSLIKESNAFPSKFAKLYLSKLDYIHSD